MQLSKSRLVLGCWSEPGADRVLGADLGSFARQDSFVLCLSSLCCTLRQPREVLMQRQVWRATGVFVAVVEAMRVSRPKVHKNSIGIEMAFDEFGDSEMDRCFLVFEVRTVRVTSSYERQDLLRL